MVPAMSEADKDDEDDPLLPKLPTCTIFGALEIFDSLPMATPMDSLAEQPLPKSGTSITVVMFDTSEVEGFPPLWELTFCCALLIWSFSHLLSSNFPFV